MPAAQEACWENVVEPPGRPLWAGDYWHRRTMLGSPGPCAQGRLARGSLDRVNDQAGESYCHASKQSFTCDTREICRRSITGAPSLGEYILWLFPLLRVGPFKPEFRVRLG
jgi:hypothetical protein